MKKTLQETVEKLKEEGLDFKEDVAVFKWSYPENPFIEYTLLIRETEQANLVFEEEVFH